MSAKHFQKCINWYNTHIFYLIDKNPRLPRDQQNSHGDNRSTNGLCHLGLEKNKTTFLRRPYYRYVTKLKRDTHRKARGTVRKERLIIRKGNREANRASDIFGFYDKNARGLRLLPRGWLLIRCGACRRKSGSGSVKLACTGLINKEKAGSARTRDSCRCLGRGPSAAHFDSFSSISSRF